MNQYIIDKHDGANKDWGGYTAMTRPESYEALEISAPDASGKFSYKFTSELSGPLNLLSEIPTVACGSDKCFSLEVPVLPSSTLKQLETGSEWYRKAPFNAYKPELYSGEKEKLDLTIKPYPRSNDAYLEYEKLFAPAQLAKAGGALEDRALRRLGLLETIEQERATMLIGVPASFNAMAMIDEETIKGYDLSSLRQVLCAGAKSSAFFLDMLEKKFHLTACEIYGLTELIIVTMGAIRDRKLGTAGKPLAELRVLDRDGKEVPRGSVGEAVARAPWMMREYYKSPELTAQVLKDGWFHTGDLVKLDENGYLEFIEKTSSIIVPSGGVKILPAAVEEVLLKHPAVAETACVGLLDD